jgi:predicted secreted protein
VKLSAPVVSVISSITFGLLGAVPHAVAQAPSQIALVYAEVQADRQAEASNRVNEAVQWALDEAEDARDVRAQTMQYTTRPVYANNNRIVGWQARQSLRLESSDTDRLSELLGVLQERVAIQSINYDVAKATRDAAEEQLISAALAQFERRARLVADELDRSGYRIVRMNISTTGRPPVPISYRTQPVVMEATVAAPALESGVQTLSVTINGTVELDAVQ